MDAQKEQRLANKYRAYASSNVGSQASIRVGRGAMAKNAMGKKGKPKNTWQTLKKLLQYISQEKVLFVIAMCCAIIHTISTLLASYLIRPLMNNFLYFDKDVSTIETRLKSLFFAILGMGIIYLISVSTLYIQQRIMLSVSQRCLKHMREELYEKMETLPVSYFDTHERGDIMSRFANDVDAVGEMLNTTLMQIISGAITITGTICLMLYTNWILGMITIIMTPLLTLVSKTILKFGQSAYSMQQETLGMLNGFCEENITGLKVVKVFNHEESAHEEFTYLNQKLRKAQAHAQFCAGIMGPTTHQLCNVSYGLVASVGAILVVLKGFDIGGLAISVNYTRTFNRPINEISMQMNTVFSALAGAERVFALMEEESEKQDENTVKMDKIEGNVVLENVSFGYNKDKTVLHDISLYAKKGQKIAFVGSTGAGKTTVTNLLSRFYDIKEGKIRIDGVSIEQIDRSFLRSNIAMVLQDTHLFSGSVKENIRYGRLDASDEEVIEAAKAASAHDFIMNLENGYDTILENDGANLSQGQRQLLNIARASISKAPILILDEATSSVDTRTEKQIEQGMDALMKNRTTFVIAHRLSTVRSADAIMVLENGRIIERGNHAQLLKLNGRYADLYHEIAQLD